jgi:hypothetical protein
MGVQCGSKVRRTKSARPGAPEVPLSLHSAAMRQHEFPREQVQRAVRIQRQIPQPAGELVKHETGANAGCGLLVEPAGGRNHAPGARPLSRSTSHRDSVTWSAVFDPHRAPIGSVRIGIAAQSVGKRVALFLSLRTSLRRLTSRSVAEAYQGQSRRGGEEVGRPAGRPADFFLDMPLFCGQIRVLPGGSAATEVLEALLQSPRRATQAFTRNLTALDPRFRPLSGCRAVSWLTPPILGMVPVSSKTWFRTR